LNSPTAVLGSDEIYIQLKAILSQEIIQLEAGILSELDKLVYGIDGIGRDNPIALWVCLWTLILSYKAHIIYLKVDILGNGNGSLSLPLFTPLNLPLTYKLEKMRIFELSLHIYNTLTSIYATLYKTTSPLTFDWRKSEIAKLLGSDKELIRHFCNIKTEMFWFRKSRHSNPSLRTD